MSSASAPKLLPGLPSIQRGVTELRGVKQTGPRVVCIGEDADLLDSRRLLLEFSGYAVVSVRPRYLSSFHPLRPIRVAIICHSVPEPMRTQVIAWIRQNFPHTQILLLDRDSQRRQRYMGYQSSGSYPEDLLKSLRDLVAELPAES